MELAIWLNCVASLYHYSWPGARRQLALPLQWQILSGRGLRDTIAAQLSEAQTRQKRKLTIKNTG